MTNAPKQVAGIRVTLGKVWFWVSQVTSAIGLISIIDDLKLWIAFTAWVTARLNELLPILAKIFVAVGQAIDAVLQVFRGIFRPVVDFCLQWLPIHIPDIVKDGLIVVVFVGLGLLRTSRKYEREHKFLNREYDRRTVALARQFGIACQESDAYQLRVAISTYRWIENGPLRDPPKAADLGRLKRWRATLEKFGPDVEAFAAANQHLHLTRPGSEARYDRERKAKKLVWVLGAITGALVLLDYRFLR